MKRVWAIRTRYKFLGGNRWCQHTTKWYESSENAWNEKDLWEKENPNIIESASYLIHKEI